MNRTRNGSKAIHESMDAIRDHAAGAAGGVRDMGEAVKDVLIEKFSEMLKRAMSFGEHGKDAAQVAARNVRDEIEARIQAHPYRALLIASGAGLMFGLLLRRR